MPTNPLDAVRQLGDQLRRSAGPELEEWLGDRLAPKRLPPLPLSELQAELDSLVGLETVKEQVHALVAFLQVQARRKEHEPAGGRDQPAPRVPRQPRHRQDDRRPPARADVPLDGPAPEGPPGRGRPRVARRPVRRRDRDQDEPRDPPRARRRAVHRRGLLAGARGRAHGLRPRGGRGAAEADGGLPPPPRRDRRRLPAADARRSSTRTRACARASRARSRSPTTRTTSWWRSARRWQATPSTRSSRRRSRRSGSIFENAQRGEGFGNARFARTIFEQALNRQALRLARVEGRDLTELDREEVTTLTADDVATAAQSLGEEPERKRRRWLG